MLFHCKHVSRTQVKLDVVACILNHSDPMTRWEGQTGEPLETYEPASMVPRQATKMPCLK